MRPRPSPLTQLLAAAVLVVAALVVVIVSDQSSPAAPPPRALASMFQDDDHLLYASTATVQRTLAELQTIGVDSVRVTALWKAIAPAPFSRTRPAGFDAANPGGYRPGAWAPYDRLVELARARGIKVLFNLTAPGPLWAMARGAPGSRYADHWWPSASQFGAFVQAIGERYSGRFRPAGQGSPLPRVSDWSIWNEPNQPGWLAPQWETFGGNTTMESPALYRAYVGAAFTSLQRTGHSPSSDTILVGELAPEGCVTGSPCAYPRQNWPIPPLAFLRALYCVGGDYVPLAGTAATSLACPQSGDRRAFVAANPGLFEASGFAHHPYAFLLAPTAPMSAPADADFVPLSELTRLEQALDQIFGSYGFARRLPVYLTEYGYETDPPNPFRAGFTPAKQALYLDEASYIAYRDPRVRALSQFLLYDSPPDRAYPPGTQGYWSTFQTGLRFADGLAKPALGAYRLPLFLPDPTLGAARRVFVWAMLRSAPHGSPERAQIQWTARGGGAFRTVATLTTSGYNDVLAASVTLPGPGFVRAGWVSPAGPVYSAAVSVRAG